MKVIYISNYVLKGIIAKGVSAAEILEIDCVLGKSFRQAQIQLAQSSIQPPESKWYHKYHNKEGGHIKQ